jgi:hypothetical protein
MISTQQSIDKEDASIFSKSTLFIAVDDSRRMMPDDYPAAINCRLISQTK